MVFESMTSPQAEVGGMYIICISLLAAVAGLLWYTKNQKPDSISAPPVPDTTSNGSADGTDGVVLVLGAGTIGASFSSVFLARGMKVVCVDPSVSREVLEKRIREYWPNLVARGIVTTTPKEEPPLDSLTKSESLPEEVSQHPKIRFVQECTWEDVDHKQKVLAELDRLVDPSVLIASSTSFITWPLLSSHCQHKHRIVIGHPAIPHTHSYMEIYGISPPWVHLCREWYAAAAFDVIVMTKTIPGHVFNSFLRVNIGHGNSLVKQGVCSVGDVNKAMRHFGRDLYARHIFVSLLLGIGGDRGVEGGKELAKRIRRDAVYLTLFSGLKGKGCPDFVARPVSRHLGRFLISLLPNVPEECVRASEELEREVTNGGEIPVQKALFRARSNVYELIPLEVGNDPFQGVMKESQ